MTPRSRHARPVLSPELRAKHIERGKRGGAPPGQEIYLSRRMLTARLLDALIGPRMYENQVGTVRALMTKEEFDDLLAWNDRCLAAGKRSER